MNPIEQMLRREIGLDASSVGPSAIERTVRLRMKNLGLKKQEDYLHILESSRAHPDPTGRDEWEQLIESVVVAETWFFRDHDSFAALVKLVQANLKAKGPPQNQHDDTSEPHCVRLLSLPCASGEEAYSLAMALLDAEIPPEQFSIDAVDISGRALARARRAVYGKNSFRGRDLAYRDRHFHATPEGHALHPRVRRCVQFHRANLLLEDDFNADAPYDFIFCRNLLIYFDVEAQTKALEKLSRLLSPQGVLFVGAAELPLATRRGFVSANLPMAFACRRAAEAKPDSLKGENRYLRAEKKTQVENTEKLTQKTESNYTFDLRSTAFSRVPALTAARQLADAGKLAEAAAICRLHLDQHGPSAQAYYLLGLVRDASPEPTESAQAMDYYRKALYLEPNHYETLLQMSLLLEKNGDHAAARRFKRRAERASQLVGHSGLEAKP